MPSVNTPAPLLTIAQVAERLNMSTSGVRVLCKTGQIPCLTFGRAWRVALQDLEAFIAARHADALARAHEARTTKLGVW